MNERVNKIFNEIDELCSLIDLKLEDFLETKKIELNNELKELFTPNDSWFEQGKSFERYWKFLESLTKRTWLYENVDYWYRILRKQSETREEVTPSLRYEVLSRDKNTCQKCGRKAKDIQLEIDHILPWSCGGATTLKNLQVLCIECNRGKSNKCFEVS